MQKVQGLLLLLLYGEWGRLQRALWRELLRLHPGELESGSVVRVMANTLLTLEFWEIVQGLLPHYWLNRKELYGSKLLRGLILLHYLLRRLGG